MNAALAEGDHVIVHHPCYQSLWEIPVALGCDVTLWPAERENAWKLDIGFFDDSIRPSTRAVVINCPHSPTGYLMSGSDWHDFLEVAQSAGLIVFSDEAYRGLEYREADRLPAACDAYGRTLSMGVLSKGYGLAGLRIGWVATRDSELLGRIASFKDYTTICSSGPGEFLASLALRNGGALLERSKRTIRANLELLAEFFQEQRDRFDWVRPLAGPVTFPTLLEDRDVNAFCSEALEEAGVLLLPGTVFSSDSREIRIGLGRESMPEALQRFATFLKEAVA